MNIDHRAVLRAVGRVPRHPRLLRYEVPLVSWNLNALATLYQSDKARHLHDYTTHYTTHFAARRRQVHRVLEIGIGGFAGPRSGGASLRMWRDWFPRADIFGIDIERKEIDEPRIEALIGDQGDTASMRAIGESYGPFDIVIDDGSHVNSHVRCSFEALWDHVVPGGWYVIEDFATSYYEEMGGGQPGTPGTSIALIKDLCDAAQHGELAPERAVRLRPELIHSVHVYPNIAFIAKATNVRLGYRV